MSWNNIIPIEFLIAEAKANGTWTEPVPYTGVHEFEIEEEFLSSCRVSYGYSSDNENKDGDISKCRTTSTKDHPAFTALREHLGAREFIEIQRQWCNGDRALKPFKLNIVEHVQNDAGEWEYDVLGVKEFEIGDQFSSAGAMGNSIRYQIKKTETEND